jgi:hypothetical protein
MPHRIVIKGRFVLSIDRLRSRAEDSRDYILDRTGQLPAWLPSPAPR